MVAKTSGDHAGKKIASLNEKYAKQNPFLRFMHRELIYPDSLRAILIITLLIVGILFTFLAFYQPFGLEPIRHGRMLLISTISGSLGLSVAGLLWLAPRVLPGFFLEGRFNNIRFLVLSFFGLIIFVALFELVIAIFQLDTGERLGPGQLSILFLDFVASPGFVLINVVDWNNKKLIIIDLNSFTIPDTPGSTESGNMLQKALVLRNSEGKVLFTLHVENFICAYSNQNYAEIYHQESVGTVTRAIVRIPFSMLFEEIKSHPNLIRCHRTRIINLSYATDLITYDRRTLLRLKYMDEAVPVSRDFPIRNYFPGR